MALRLAGFVALVLIGLSLGACGTKGSLGFKQKSTTTTVGRTTRSTQGDDSLEDDAPSPPPDDLEDPIDFGPGLHHPGCPSPATPTPTTPTPTTARPARAFAMVATAGSSDGPDTGC